MRRATEAAALLLIAVLAGLAAVGGCAKSEPPEAKRALTERERDSLISKSVLPGAAVVGRAMEISDSAAVHAAASTP